MNAYYMYPRMPLWLLKAKSADLWHHNELWDTKIIYLLGIRIRKIKLSLRKTIGRGKVRIELMRKEPKDFIGHWDDDYSHDISLEQMVMIIAKNKPDGKLYAWGPSITGREIP